MESLEQQFQRDYNQDVEAEYLMTTTKLGIWEAREEVHLAQKEKKKWLQEGNQNSRFFHAIVNQRWKDYDLLYEAQ